MELFNSFDCLPCDTQVNDRAQPSTSTNKNSPQTTEQSTADQAAKIADIVIRRLRFEVSGRKVDIKDLKLNIIILI